MNHSFTNKSEFLKFQTHFLMSLFFIIGAFTYSNAQSCASGTVIDLDENEFPLTCVTSNGADGTSTSATFNHDFVTNTAGNYTNGADGTDDVTVTMTTACSFPNGTNGTTVAGACLGSTGIVSTQSAPQLTTGVVGGSDFAGATVNDAPCANCWVIVEYEFINGFTSSADGFDIDWSSMNGSTEGYEAWGGWVEGSTFTAPTVTTANLETYCHAQAVAGETMMTWLTGVGPAAALPAGVFGADAMTAGGSATACPAEEPPSSSGANSTVSTGMADGVIPANWGLTSTDIINKVTFIYIMSNSNGDDCDADGATSVNTSPSGSLSTVDFCVPAAVALACDAEPGTVNITSPAFICALDQGIDKLTVETNGDFTTAPADPCGLAGTPGVGFLIYSGIPNGGDPCTDPNFTGASLGTGPVNQPGCLNQNVAYSYGTPACAGPFGWGEIAGVPNSNINTTFQVCPIYLFDEATGLTAVDYDCTAGTDLCGPVVGTDCEEFVVLGPVNFDSDALVCGGDPYLGTLTVNVSGGYPGYVTATGLDPLGNALFAVAETTGNGTLAAATVADGGTITLLDIADGAYSIEVTDPNGCVHTFAGVWNQPTISLTASAEKVCQFENDCSTANIVDLTGLITPMLGRFQICGTGDGFPSETSWQITNADGDVVAGAGPGSAIPGLTGGLDPNGTYFITFFDTFGDGFSCLPVPNFTVIDDGGAGCGGTVVYTYGAGDWEGANCGDTDNANFPNGDGSTFGPFPLGSPTAFIDPIGVLSGTGVSDNLDNTGTFDANMAAGDYTVNYDLTDAAGCVLHAELIITICANPAAPVPIEAAVLVCTTDDLTDALGVAAIVGVDFSWFGPSASAPADVTTGAIATGTTYTPALPTTVGVAETYWVVPSVTDPVSGLTCYGCPVSITITSEVCCMLDLTCPTGPVALECIGDLPPVGDAVAILAEFTAQGGVVIESCNPVTIVVSDVDDGAAGCMGTPRTVTRTFTIADPITGESESCPIDYVFMDVTLPVITCPADVTVECDASTLPADTGMATATDNCDAAPVVTFADATAAGTCAQESVISRTWTATDACGNASTCTQIITVEDTTPPTITCPADVTVECDASTLPADTGMATATDNCDAVAAVTFVDATAAGACAQESVISRTWTATDACGNASTCTQIITVEDTNPPMITCPADVTIECDQPTDPGATGNATAMDDNCATDVELTVVFVDLSTQTPTGCGNDSYTITRTWTASDPCGNTAQCVQTITIEDTSPPTIVCPADLTIECDEDTAPANTGTATAVDDCTPAADITITFVDASTQEITGCEQYQYVITRTWTAEDPCGNSSTCVQTIMVEDSTPPAIVCPADVSLSCTDSTDPTATGTATGSDNCSTVAEVIITSADISTQGTEGCAQYTYSILRTWTATDACGNTTTCVQSIDVADTVAPVVTCPPGQTLTCFETVPPAITNGAGFIAAGGTIADDCTMDLSEFTVFQQTLDNGGDNCPGNARLVTRTYFIQDACGNTSTCEQTFTYLESTQGPVITSVLPACYKYCASLVNPMESDITYETDCSFGATVNITGPTFIGQENCPGSITRFTYTVTDDCGRTSAPVTRDFIIQNDGPTIEVPAFNLILECNDPNNQDYVEAHLGLVTANTSCGLGATISYSPQNFNFTACGSGTVVTFVVTDDCGRTASATTTIAVQDNEAPSFTNIPPSICDAAECGGDVNYWYNHWIDYMLAGLEAEDDCDTNVSITSGNTPLNTSCDPTTGDAITTVTFVATDNCGNTASYLGTFTIENEFPASFENLPADASVDCGDPIVFGPAPTVVNGCNTSVTTMMMVDDSDPCNVLHTRVWIATDDCGGLTTTAAQTITETDNVDPVISGGADLVVECTEDVLAAGLAWAATNAGATASDACNSVIWTNNVLTAQPVLTPDCADGALSYADITFTATDACGNASSVTYRISVIDTTAPTFTSVPTGGTVACAADMMIVEPTAADACSAVVITSTDDTVGDDCSGTLTRIWTATDACGNTTTASATFNYVDTEAPTATNVPTDITISCTETVVFGADPVWSDNCDTDIFSSSEDTTTPGDCAGNYSVTRDWAAIDECGNLAVVSQTITVEDNIAPVFTSVPTGGMMACGDPDFGDAEATDACSSTVTITFDDVMSGAGCSGGGTTRTWTATDECGNSATASATYIINDDEAPVFTSVPTGGTEECGSTVDFGDVEATDNCGQVTVTFNDEMTGSCAGSITRTWTATDVCGNTATASATITFSDDEAPVFTYIPDVADLDCDDDLTPEAPQASDNCGAVTVEITNEDINGALCDDGYAIHYTWTATDACGNTATASTSIWIDPDNEAPVFTFVPAGDYGDCANFPPVFGEPVVEDACGSVSLTFIDEAVGNINGCDENENFDYRRVWTATDACGNTSTAKQTFWILVTGPSANVGGLIATEEGDAVEDVEVTLTGGANFSQMYVTEADGMYEFDNLPTGANYMLDPYSNDFPMNGVSTYDLVLISKHILSLEMLDSPYKMIAADINRSGSITTFDLVELRKMILFINTEFPNNDSWRFVDADFVFPYVENPFATAFPELVNINGLLGSELYDFVGVKVGDVNNTAVANEVMEADERTFNGELSFNVKDMSMKIGETYEVVFSSSEFKTIAGYQYTLNFDTDLLEFVDVTAGDLVDMSESNFGLSLLDEGAITTSWMTNGPISMSPDSDLFRLTFKAKRTIQLSQALSVNSRYTAAEAYDVSTENGQLNLLNVSLRFEDATGTSAPFALMQNTPNPFRDQTVIGFVLPAATSATMTIFDVSGRQLKLISGEYEAGYNEISLSRDDLPKGVLYYELKTSTNNATKKMLLIN